MLTLPQTIEQDGAENRRELDRLLAGVAAGDRDALARLYRLTRTAVYGLALSYMKNPQDAQDVAQDAFVRIWDSAPQYQSQGSPMGWILTVTRNLALMKLRNRGREADWRRSSGWPSPRTPPAYPPRTGLCWSRPGHSGGAVPADRAPPRRHRPEAPGDRAALGAPSGHRFIQVPPRTEKAESTAGRR